MTRQGRPSSEMVQQYRVDLRGESITLEIPVGVHPPSSSSIDLARLFDIQPGENALDLGCGSGLLAIAAVKRGAGHVIATEADPYALGAALRNAVTNDVRGDIEGRVGSWYEALREYSPNASRPFQVILATPPQTPAPRPCGPRYGGWDGTDHLRQVIEGAPARLSHPEGRLWLLVISLAHPARLMKNLSELFSDIVLVKETQRFFSAAEYDALTPGLFHHLLDLRAAGQAEFRETDDGRYVFRNLFIRAAGCRGS